MTPSRAEDDGQPTGHICTTVYASKCDTRPFSVLKDNVIWRGGSSILFLMVHLSLILLLSYLCYVTMEGPISAACKITCHEASLFST